MRQVYADAAYCVALSNPRDDLHAAAVKASEDIGNGRIVTSDAVLAEFLNFARKPSGYREIASRTVREILDNANVEVEPWTHRGFLEALEFYESRKDKEYTFIDCVSMAIMKARGIRDVLTHDRHFTQEGFTILL